MSEETSTPSGSTHSDVKIVFTPSGRQGRVPHGTSVLAAARQLGVDIDSVCGGRAMCGRCQVNVGTGEFAKHGISSGDDSLDAVTAVETRYADKRGLADGRRLSCQAKLCADVVIDVPPESQVHNQLVRKEADGRQIEMDPIVRLCFVEVREPPTGAAITYFDYCICVVKLFVNNRQLFNTVTLNAEANASATHKNVHSLIECTWAIYRHV